MRQVDREEHHVRQPLEARVGVHGALGAVEHARRPQPLVRRRAELEAARDALGRARGEVEDAGGGLDGDAHQALAHALDEAGEALGVRAFERRRDEPREPLDHAARQADAAAHQPVHRVRRRVPSIA
jgi:hypothetical protein